MSLVIENLKIISKRNTAIQRKNSELIRKVQDKDLKIMTLSGCYIKGSFEKYLGSENLHSGLIILRR